MNTFGTGLAGPVYRNGRAAKASILMIWSKEAL